MTESEFTNELEQTAINTTNRNSNSRFKDLSRGFIYSEGKSRFPDHVIKDGHENNTRTHDYNAHRKQAWNNKFLEGIPVNILKVLLPSSIMAT